VFYDAVDGAHAVLPADLPTLLLRATIVGNSYLIDPELPPLGDLRRDFGLETEPGLLDLDRLDDLSAERLEAGLHVGEIQVGEHVRQHREETVAEAVPVIEHPMGLPAREAGPEHHIRPARHDGFDHAGMLVRVVFEIGVLDE